MLLGWVKGSYLDFGIGKGEQFCTVSYRLLYQLKTVTGVFCVRTVSYFLKNSTEKFEEGRK